MTIAPASPTAAQVLARAAEAAASQPTVRRAIRSAWSACHASHDLTGAVFAAWQHAEDITCLYDLGPVLHRRYRRGAPADIAASLRKAAAACAEPGAQPPPVPPGPAPRSPH
jgi:hypothetical protein